MFILLLLVLALSVPTIAEAQTTCSALGGGTLYCDGPRGSSSITELSPGMGIIQTERGTEPYSIIGRDEERRSSYRSDRLPELERLPSYGGSSSYGESSYEQRERAREERYGR